ncbi:hypothetical protein ACWDXD_25195 [Streptomyces sp. NPDC003314]
MTRYGFAIKALPPGAKPFGEEDDDNDQTTGPDQGASPEAEHGDSDLEPFGSTDKELPEDPAPGPDTPPEEPADNPAAPAPQPEDDSRPWAGDPYSEGNETDPTQAFATYGGGDGEEAWLDKAPDGTLTGWVRDATGEVWRYTDADAWATDVDGAQMTRTQGPDTAPATDNPSAPAAPGPAPGVQDDLFANQ